MYTILLRAIQSLPYRHQHTIPVYLKEMYQCTRQRLDRSNEQLPNQTVGTKKWRIGTNNWQRLIRPPPEPGCIEYSVH